jgi:hypothetical protein
MFGSFLRFFMIASRAADRPIQLKPGVRYLATLDLTKVRPGMNEADVREWLMKLGFTPTAKPHVWKADERFLSRLPQGSILKAEKF